MEEEFNRFDKKFIFRQNYLEGQDRINELTEEEEKEYNHNKKYFFFAAIDRVEQLQAIIKTLKEKILFYKTKQSYDNDLDYYFTTKKDV